MQNPQVVLPFEPSPLRHDAHITKDMPDGFDQFASQFDARRGKAREDEIRALHDLLYSEDTVLDVGGGTGRYAAPLSALGHRMTVIDRSRGMLMEASKKVLLCVQGDTAWLPFKNEAFDAVLFVEMLHLVEDWTKAIHEMGRVTPGPIAAVVREREPDHRRIYLETRAEMGMSTGRLDEGVLALCRMLSPSVTREVWKTEERVDLEERIRLLESQATQLGEPVHPEVARTAVAKIVEAYGSSMVTQTETVKVAMWHARDFRGFTPPVVNSR